MGDRIRHKGRFIKKKVLDKKLKIKNALQEKRKGNDDTSESNLCEGIRLVDLIFCIYCYN